MAVEDPLPIQAAIVERINELGNAAVEFVGQKLDALFGSLLGGGFGGSKSAGGVALASTRGGGYDPGFSPAASPAVTPTLPTKQESIAQAQNIAVSLPGTALDMVKEIQTNFAAATSATSINTVQNMQVVSVDNLGDFKAPITPAVTGMARGQSAGIGV